MNAEEANKRIAQLEEALMLMVYQYCVTDLPPCRMRWCRNRRSALRKQHP